MSAAGSTVPVGLCGRHTTTTRAWPAASAIASRSWWPCSSSATVTETSRAICAKIGYPSNVGDVITMLSPGLVTACSTCMITPVAPAPITTCSSRTPTRPAISDRNRSGRNSGYRLATSTDSDSADRTAGSGGNGFSLSDSANGFTALGSAETTSGSSRLAMRHQSATAPL